MEVIDVKDFDDFENVLKDINYSVLSKNKEFAQLNKLPQFLYRGQSNECWLLETTLDRYCNHKSIAISDYHRKALCAKNVISSYTERKWLPPDYEAFEANTNKASGMLIPFEGYIETFKYYVHLRHHGFPSPLLDWSASPYVALFFACCQYLVDKKQIADAAVFVYLERIITKGGLVGDASIETIGPNLESNKRHHMQQSQYSICVRKAYSDNQGDGHFEYRSHQEVFDKSSGDQDIVWKLIIPSDKQEKILRKLDTFNINSYTLFDSEESLMQMLAFRMFY